MKQKKRWVRLAGLALLAFARAGQAQSYVVGPPVAQPYVPLAGATIVTLTAGGAADQDEGAAAIPLGFSFPYYGNTYTSVVVNANGILLFDPSKCKGAGFDLDCYENDTFPSSSRGFHNFLAAWWDDLDGANAGSVVRYLNPSGSELVVEFANWNYFVGSSSFSFQVRLNASGLIQIHYGSHSGTEGDASAGFENSAGTQGANLLSCSPLCSGAGWPTNTLYTIGEPVQPDLVASEVNLSNMVEGASSISFTVTPTFRNWGQQPANNFLWRAYLSSNKIKEAADPEIFTAAAPISVPGKQTATDSGSVTISPKPAPGQYYVLVEADHTNLVAEFSEANNVGSTASYFTQGVDLVASSVSGPALSGPGNTIQVNAKYFNQGSTAAGLVELKLHLSANKTLESNDFLLHRWTRTVTGGQTVDELVSVAVPANVPGGTLYFLLELDSSQQVAEASETNNLAVSAATVTMQQGDLLISLIELLDPVTSAPTQAAYFGQPTRVAVTLENAGGADARSFHLGLMVSSDTNPSRLVDSIVHDEPVALAAAGVKQTVTFTFTMPLKDKDGKDFAEGTYFLFGLADSFNAVTELYEDNNHLMLPGAISIRAPAQDYLVTRLEAPASAAVGEVVPVFRIIKNAGNATGSKVSYRMYASANAIITSDDIPLGLVGPGGATSETAEVTLALGAEDRATDLVKLPTAMSPGVYYLGCIVDLANAAAELDERNNAAASSSTVQVAASALRVSSTQLPDGVVDRPYHFRLVAAGAQGASSWALDQAQGGLPPGLSLAADGTLSGVPTTPVVSSFTVLVTSGGKSAAARLVLRVLPPTTELEVTTSALPPVVNLGGLVYQASLAAAGGVKPYGWKVASGRLPDGINLSPEGVLGGSLRPGAPLGESRVLFEVSDSLGSRAQAEIKVRVVAPGALMVKSLAVPDSMVNSDYLADLSAANADGKPLAKPLAWTVVSGALPDGLGLATEDEERGILSGKPLVAGTYAFSLQVEDARGRADTADYILKVFAGRFRLAAVNPPTVIHPGDKVEVRITAAGAGAGARFSLHSGALPPGLSVDEQGNISGTVSMEKAVGVYNFVVEARDVSGASGLGAFTLEVTQAPPRVGCSSTGGGLWALLGLLPLCWSRRRIWAGTVAAVALMVSNPAWAQLPDLVVSGVSSPTQATPGQTLSINRVISNAGNAPAGASSSYTYFVSDNAVAAVSDRALTPSLQLAALSAGQSDTRADSVTLPSDLAAGMYWIGVCVDFDPGATPPSKMEESNEVNNCATAAAGFVLNTGALAVITSSLPGATQHSPYGLRLQASGGDGSYAWAQTGGNLPAGLGLSSSGDLMGTPSSAGAFSFTVEVRSGGSTASAQLSLQVTPANLPLVIADQELPTAEFARAYRAQLLAVGGKPPYVWKMAAEAKLPVGLALSTDGQLEGRASEAGVFPFSVALSDSAGTQATKDLRIRVVTPASLHIATAKLATGYLKKDYLQNLTAVGGRPPYEWSVVSFQQLAENATEQPGKTETALPLGFGLKIEKDSGGQSLLRGVPSKAGLFAVAFRVQDSAGSDDLTTLPLQISYEEALAITTLMLPDAFVGHPYSARLSHNGGPQAMDVQFNIPCVKQVAQNLKDFGCALTEPLQTLPGGLFLGADGMLSGTPAPPAIPTATDSQGNPQPLVFSFLVKVTDAPGRQDVRSLSIKVWPDYTLEKTGCAGAGMAPSLLALLAVAGLVRRRRRLAIASSLVGLTLISCGGGPKNLCLDQNVSCEAPLACDPSDGICKCGGRGGVVCQEAFVCDALSNTCQSTRCRGVECSGGQSCDQLDGKCKCGGTGGLVCAEGEVCLPGSRVCAPPIDCSQVACPANQTCDPLTVKCRCGVFDCPAPKFCSVSSSGERTCIESLCSGVSCAGANGCDQSDGYCKCSGAVCQSGEACSCPDGGSCETGERACRPSSSCAGVVCQGGTTCDPTDGKCKCGGPGGPVCAVDQLCALGPPAQCQGGKQCSLPDGGAKSCAGGLSCDPEDGKCKCGGRGGTICKDATATEPAEVCVSWNNQRACKRPCDPRSQDCPSGAHCYFDSTAAAPVAYCSAPTGSKIEGQACSSPAACFAQNPPRPLHCNGLAQGISGLCRPYCDTNAGSQGCVQVPVAQVCDQIQGAPAGYGYCHPQ